MDSPSLKDINKKLDELINAYQRTKDENRKLKAETESWQHERQRLLQQNELARNKIAEMLSRLKLLEHEPNE
ncbi:TIGR02449 family protein [Bermanella sp. WJH001]|jgi:cell division protein ZapB|uniref:TIGR02449 family protein n=1 Tax=Bermanella sp. WJH001 TaxID=3048005 RepID=UPI0024BF0666|nr:TIGR02449 family protein [Bermanella sp. WJH001]MDJ1539020.1 TIGR02449 family protein [Bermanella sp. WJH001]